MKWWLKGWKTLPKDADGDDNGIMEENSSREQWWWPVRKNGNDKCIGWLVGNVLVFLSRRPPTPTKNDIMWRHTADTMR